MSKENRIEYTTYIGLEIHIQLLTKTKAFCSCRTSFGAEPNTHICPVCLGYPGVLPALNENAVFKAYQVAQALSCTLSPSTVFERKNYFYPDMPKNYQISQYAHPIGRNGYIDFPVEGGVKRVGIHDVHLEEDAGKMIHGGDITLLDYNRAGTPLLEIVTEPDLRSGEEAEAFIQYFRSAVRHMEVCDGNMEEGSLRCDANVSVNPVGQGLGTKVEIKNLNSSRFVRLSLSYESRRHEKMLREGKSIVQETRLWNENRDITVGMRTKEESHDYRYFPEPDLPPFQPTEEFLSKVRKSLEELPLSRRNRFIESYGVTDSQAVFLAEEKERSRFFEESVALGADPREAAVWLTGEVLYRLNRNGSHLGEPPLTTERFADILRLMADGTIHGKLGKQLLQAVFEEDKDPRRIIEERGWKKITAEDELLPIIHSVIESHPEAAGQARGGEEKVLGFLMGQIMGRTSGRAEPQLSRQILIREIQEKEEE
ncbi:MAG: Asp-tRNA(Asn)/Glu-tRNA(Gln) amidotransferase subunit GatB [Spirochaetaceae bacterium]